MLSDRQILECELLVVQCQRGETAAFESLVRMWERPLFYYLRRLASSEEDAWDLLQETWLKTYRSIRSLRNRARSRRSSIRPPATRPSVVCGTASSARN